MEYLQVFNGNQGHTPLIRDRPVYTIYHFLNYQVMSGQVVQIYKFKSNGMRKIVTKLAIF